MMEALDEAYLHRIGAEREDDRYLCDRRLGRARRRWCAERDNHRYPALARSAANAGNRSTSWRAQRNSLVTSLPSTMSQIAVVQSFGEKQACQRTKGREGAFVKSRAETAARRAQSPDQ
jgi:hypothetical protein